MIEADTCERCDGRGCRSCSGRGWLSRELPEVEVCSKVYPATTVEDIDRMSGWSTAGAGGEVESPAGTKKDTEVHGRGDEPEDDGPKCWPPEVCRSCNQVTGIDDRNGLCSDCNRELKKASPAAELQEPDEKVRITVEYPGQTVKLIKVRYGTLSKALAEALDGRPWK